MSAPPTPPPVPSRSGSASSSATSSPRRPAPSPPRPNNAITYNMTAVSKGRSHNPDATRYNQLNDVLIKQFGRLLTDEDFHDVTVLVGHEEEPFRANRTALALRCQYFKELFMTPNQRKPTVVRLPTLDPTVFRAVLNRIHMREGCLQIKSLSDAWVLRRAAKLLEMKELQEELHDYLQRHVNHKEYALTLLRQTEEFDVPIEIKTTVLKTIRKAKVVRFILHEPEIRHLSLGLLQELLNLYQGRAKASHIYHAIHTWGAGQDTAVYHDALRTVLFQLVPWEKMSRKELRSAISSLPHDLESLALRANVQKQKVSQVQQQAQEEETAAEAE